MGLRQVEKHRCQVCFTDPSFSFQQHHLRLTVASLLVEYHESTEFRSSSHERDVQQWTRG